MNTMEDNPLSLGRRYGVMIIDPRENYALIIWFWLFLLAISLTNLIDILWSWIEEYTVFGWNRSPEKSFEMKF
jgi:hypothetical protein